MRFGATELILIFAVLLLLFGATRLPQLGSSIGQAIRNFKKGFGGEADEPGGGAQGGGTGTISEGREANTAPKAKERT